MSRRPTDARQTTRLPALGRRGEGWVAGQLVLTAAVFLSPLAGRVSVGGYSVAGYTLGSLLLAAGLALLAWAGRALGRSLTPFPAPRAQQDLTTNGPYAHVRHPMYGAVILVALGWSALFAAPIGIALSILLALFFDLKARREEAWLRQRLEGYDDYRGRTPRRLVPFLY